jgi:ADP-ribosylglycohydrolase
MPNQGLPDGLTRAYSSLEGLSVGDAFGERFFVSNDIVEYLIENRAVPRGERHWQEADTGHPVWSFTDDTMMALSIVESLRLHAAIDPDWLAADFARWYDYTRGYGPAMHSYLARISEGEKWREESIKLFGGQGSFGNGAAMRVAPLGGYFADDLDAVVEHARISAEVTHAHPEAIAGAIAVVVAAAWAYRLRGTPVLPREGDFLDLILPSVPDSEVREGIRRARNLASGASVRLAASALGSGVRVSAQDTVPFALWCASRHLDNFEEAMWLTVSGLGDRDTTCAIVGGIVALYTGVEGIPEEWRKTRETLPDWFSELA